MEKKHKTDINKVLYVILYIHIVIALLVMAGVWNIYMTHRYDGQVFYISDEGMPQIEDTTFEKNKDGSYTAKLYGIFPTGTCYIHQVDRPSVELVNTGLYIDAASVGSVMIKSFSFPNSPAEKAGLQVGDYIYSCNDFVPTNSSWDLTGAVTYIRPNKMVVMRDKQLLTFYVPTNEDNLMGITYGPATAILGTMCFRDDNYFWGIGHNTGIDVINAGGAFVSFVTEDNEIKPRATTRKVDYIIKSATDKGVLGKIENEYDFLAGRDVDLAWEWEVDTTKPATIELALLDNYSGDAVIDLTEQSKHEIGVTIEPFNGKLQDIDGNTTCEYSYKIKSDGYNFLRGMSGSPVLQNNRLIGILAAVDVNDPTTAFVLSAEDAYLQFQEEREELT